MILTPSKLTEVTIPAIPTLFAQASAIDTSAVGVALGVACHLVASAPHPTLETPALLAITDAFVARLLAGL